MSGITPLLDTLLHQVLGKRVDTAPPRDLTEPVRQVDPGEGPRALHSDSRLDGRRSPLAPLPGTATPGQRPESQAPRADTQLPPASTQTHFSASARTIADLLVRFPAPPSVLSTAAPLMSAEESPSATTLAGRLQSGIRDSGLFYESHLSRWYRGEVTRQQLEREPQMLRTLRFTPASPGQGGISPSGMGGATPSAAQGLPQAGPVPGAAPSSTPGQAASGLVPQPGQVAQPGPLAQPGHSPQPVPAAPQGQFIPGQSQAAQATHSYVATEALYPASSPGARPGGEMPAPAASQGREALAPTSVRGEGGEVAPREVHELATRARPAGGEPVHESLQGVVRHQLEMLVSPVLRWEGDVWSGIFMALMIQMPAGARREGEGASADEDESHQEAWHSELQLSVPRLGDIHVSLWLQEHRVRLQLLSRDEAALAVLQAGVPELERRLHAAGMTTVLVDARPWGDEEEWRGDERSQA